MAKTMSTMGPVEVRTTAYAFAHGKAPRGTGAWAFVIGCRPDLFWFTGSYGEAKRAAVAEARRRGAIRVEVQP